MTKYGKVEISPNRNDWHPVPLPEQVVLVTTRGAEGQPHIATKTRLSVISYGPPTIIVFACRKEYPTAANITATGEFVLNVPGDDMVATSWIIGSDPHARGIDLFEEYGLTSIPAEKVAPPRIAECRAHLECKVVDTREFPEEIAAFGEVVSVSMDARLTERKDPVDNDAALAPFFFLEAGRTAPLGRSRAVEEPVPGPKHDVTILATNDLARSVGFYTKAFDWQVRVHSKTYVEFELPGGLGLALCTPNGFERCIGCKPNLPSEGVTPVQVYLRSDDLARTIARLHAAGARPLSKLKSRDWGEEAAYFTDPDGHVLVVSRPTPTK
jgi:flavin reductase (DIM6/NTAB) family NADH-FMN oxidoreductase RutF/predicted enzyme related to lactoylglutathione lyase